MGRIRMPALGNTRHLCRRYTILLCGLFCLAAVAAPPSPHILFVPATTTPKINATRAVQLARGYSGLASQPVSAMRSGLMTDNTIPFHHVVKRPAWRIAFAHVTILCRQWQQMPKRNAHLTTLTVWIDAVDGTLLKTESSIETDRCVQDLGGHLLRLASPNPHVTGLTHITVDEIEQIYTGTERFVHTAKMPALPLLRVLIDSDITADTTDLTAYFGLYSDTRALVKAIRNRPGWLLVFNGTILIPKGPGPGRPHHGPLPADELVVLDAQTGK